MQHRGGPAGFIKVLEPKTVALADFVGNRQSITIGNLAQNDRAFYLEATLTDAGIAFTPEEPNLRRSFD